VKEVGADEQIIVKDIAMLLDEAISSEG
jgi:hypothetical protein